MPSAPDGYLMKWGSYTFKLNTAAYQKLKRQDTWRWITQERFNNDPAEQYVGRGSRVMTMEGVIFTAFNPGSGIPGQVTEAVGTHQLDLLRYYASQGTAAMLVDGRGNVYGQWALVSLVEDGEYFLINGAPQKQTFHLEFRYYAPDSDGGYVTLSDLKTTVDGAATPTQRATEQALIAKGIDPGTARTMAQTVSAFQASQSNTVNPATATTMATTLAQTFGYTGAGFDGALGVVNSGINANGGTDADSLLNTGLPKAADNLKQINVSDRAAGNTALAILGTAPTTTDRGAFLERSTSQIVEATHSGKLAELGIDAVKIGNLDQSQRVPATIAALADVKANSPEAFAGTFPPETYGELNILVDNSDAFQANTLSVAGATGGI